MFVEDIHKGHLQLSGHFSDIPNYLSQGLDFLGNPEYLSHKKKISIIGSRQPSPLGAYAAKKLVEHLSRKGFCTISGLAQGIDTIVHQESIVYGMPTIAVMGTPIDKVYPTSNRSLYENIAKDYLVLSQFPSGSSTRRSNFPLRNRTMAYLSFATIICDATENSGTRHQAIEARKLGRQIYILDHLVSKRNIGWIKSLMNNGAKTLKIEQLDTLGI